MKRTMIAAVVLAMAAGAGMARADAKVSDKEGDFLRDAARGGMMEVKLGNVAEKQGDNHGVQAFGRRMVTDHEAMASELKALAKKKDVGLPDDLGEKHKAMVDELKDKSGTDFDKAYMKMMVQDHQDDLAEFRKMSTDAKDEDVRAFAAKYTPTLEEHLQLAKDQARKVGVKVDSGKKKAKKG